MSWVEDLAIKERQRRAQIQAITKLIPNFLRRLLEQFAPEIEAYRVQFPEDQVDLTWRTNELSISCSGYGYRTGFVMGIDAEGKRLYWSYAGCDAQPGSIDIVVENGVLLIPKESVKHSLPPFAFLEPVFFPRLITGDQIAS